MKMKKKIYFCTTKLNSFFRHCRLLEQRLYVNPWVFKFLPFKKHAGQKRSRWNAQDTHCLLPQGNRLRRMEGKSKLKKNKSKQHWGSDGGGGRGRGIQLSLFPWEAARCHSSTMQNNVTVINKQAFPLLYIVTLFPKFYHFIQIPVADFRCPQQQTALVWIFVCANVMQILLCGTASCKGGWGGGRLYCGTAGT